MMETQVYLLAAPPEAVSPDSYAVWLKLVLSDRLAFMVNAFYHTMSTLLLLRRLHSHLFCELGDIHKQNSHGNALSTLISIITTSE